MNASSLILFTIQALNTPTRAATARVTSTAAKNGTPQLTNSAAITPDSAARGSRGQIVLSRNDQICMADGHQPYQEAATKKVDDVGH